MTNKPGLESKVLSPVATAQQPFCLPEAPGCVGRDMNGSVTSCPLCLPQRKAEVRRRAPQTPSGNNLIKLQLRALLAIRHLGLGAQATDCLCGQHLPLSTSTLLTTYSGPGVLTKQLSALTDWLDREEGWFSENVMVLEYSSWEAYNACFRSLKLGKFLAYVIIF